MNLFRLGAKIKMLRSWIKIFILAGVFSFTFSKDFSVKFQRLGIEDGLSQSSVFSIVQDKRGFLWFATQDGLNRYDGKEFRIFRNDLSNPKSLSYDYIRVLYVDRDGILWVGTYGGGLNKYDPKTEKFIRFQHEEKNPESLSNDYINAIFQDSKGILWVGTEEGLNALDPRTGKFRRYLHDPSNPDSLIHNKVTCIYEDSLGNLWIGTFGGLEKFDSKKEKFIHYVHDPANPFSLIDNRVKVIYEDRRSNLWIGTLGGLERLDRKNEKFFHYRHSPDNPNSISSNMINAIFEDSKGNLWIGTHAGGLNRFDRKRNRFIRYTHNTFDPYSLSNDLVYSLFEDRTGVLWIGTHIGLNKLDLYAKPFIHYYSVPNDPDSLSSNYVRAVFEDGDFLFIGTYSGLDVLNRKTGKFLHFRADPSRPFALRSNLIRAIIKDSRGNLWVGTYVAGLFRFDFKRRRFYQYKHDPEDPNSISNNFVKAIYEDRKGNLWVGTVRGLNKLDPNSGKFHRYLHKSKDPLSLSHNYIYSIFEDSKGNLWVGTLRGLNKLEEKTGKFIRYMANPEDPHSLKNNEIFSIHEDEEGNLWIGTAQGLHKFRPGKGVIRHYTVKDGLPNNMIYCILEDRKGNLWLSTGKGLSCFDPRTETFRNFFEKDGLQSDEFNLGACYRSNEGELFFGGIKGLTAFSPEQIKNNPFPPKVVITKFLLFNKPVLPGEEIDGQIVLKQSITESRQVVLSYKHKVISFEFAALHFSAPEENQFAYKMEGLEKDWNYVGNKNFATYAFLPPGNYVFRVKASNRDGIWNQLGTAVRIKVLPPFWMTWQFRLLMTLTIIFLIIGAIQLRTKTIAKRARVLEEKVRERTSALVQQILEKERAQEEAQKRAAQTSLLYQLAQRLTGKLELESLFAEIAQAVQEAFNYYGVMVLLMDEKEKRLVLKSISGRFAELVPLGLKIDLGYGMIGRAALTGEIQLSNDVSKNPYYVRFATEPTRAELSVPIKKEGKVIGVLDVQSDRIGAFDESDVRIMEALSHQLAIVIDNAKLYEELRRSEERYRNLFNNLPIGIYRTTPEGRILDGNPAMMEIYAFPSREEMLKVNITDFYLEEEDRNRWLELLKNVGTVYNFEVRQRRYDGKIIWVRESARAIKNEEGKIVSIEGAVEDVTELKKLQDQLIQAQKMEDLGRLSAGIAHEFNNYLQLVLGLGEMTLMELSEEDPVAKNIKEIVEATLSIKNFVKQLLTFSRRQPMQPELYNLNEVVSRYIKIIRKVIGENIKVVFKPSPEIKPVYVDRGLIEQAIMNLCVNAKDAMPEGGELTIKTELVRFEEKPVSEAEKGEYVVLSVSDTGVGIPPEIKNRIFEPFFTTKQPGKGTGLGLSVVYGIVKQHGGFIRVKSQPGKGTTFELFLPAAQVKEEKELERERRKKLELFYSAGKGQTLLVAEDEELLRSLAKKLLEKAGYRVFLARDGEEAVKLFKRHKDEIDLAIIDAVMPKMNGLEVCQKLRKEKPRLPIIFTTGYGYEVLDEKEIARIKEYKLLFKPYRPEELLQSIQDLLGQKKN